MKKFIVMHVSLPEGSWVKAKDKNDAIIQHLSVSAFPWKSLEEVKQIAKDKASEYRTVEIVGG